MKKILLLLLLATFSIQAQTLQNPTYGNVKLKNNTTDNSATKVNVQSTDGTINTISKSDLVNVVEVNDVPSLLLVGEVGKIYVVKNVNKIYRWNGTFYQELAGSDISGLQAQIDLKANNSDVVKLTGNQSITGTKTFNNSTSGTSVVANNTSTGTGLSAVNSSTGTGIYSNNQSTGKGIHSDNNSTGISIYSLNYQSGNGIVSNQGASGTGFNYVGQNNGTNTFTVNKLGATTATSFIKSASPANNILLAGGGDIAQNTAFNKNFGTTAGTVVEGGTLGSNAYTSTAYLPLTGGTINANNETINYKVSSNNGALYNSWYDFNNNRISFLGFGAGTQSNATFFVASENGGNIALTTTGVGKVVVPSLSGTGTRTVVADASGNLSTDSTVYAPLASPLLTGTPTAPTATVGTNTNQIATTAFVLANSSARPYKVYTALLTQTGTNAPVATVLENTLGTVNFTRSSNGVYSVNSSGLFTADKTFVIMGAGTNAAYTNAINLINSSVFSIVTKLSSTQSDADSANTKVAFEIRVYL